MSGLYFAAWIDTSKSDEAVDFINLLLKAKQESDDGVRKQLLNDFGNKYAPDSLITAPCLAQLSINSLTKGVFEISAEHRDLTIDFFESFADLLSQVDGISYKARLFDSSSGGIAVWRMPEEDELDFENLLVCMLDVDEGEGLHETLVDAGAILKNEFDDEAKLFVYSDEVDIKSISTKISMDSKLVHQDDFWDEFEWLAC